MRERELAAGKWTRAALACEEEFGCCARRRKLLIGRLQVLLLPLRLLPFSCRIWQLSGFGVVTDSQLKQLYRGTALRTYGYWVGTLLARR